MHLRLIRYLSIRLELDLLVCTCNAAINQGSFPINDRNDIQTRPSKYTKIAEGEGRPDDSLERSRAVSERTATWSLYLSRKSLFQQDGDF